MFNKEEEIKKNDINTVFGQQTEFDGELRTKGSIRIEGKITGTIDADGDVFVGESGVVSSNIEARKVVIAGKVNGNVTVNEKLEILQTGTLKGDIKAKKLVIEEGAKFIGKSEPLENKGNETKVDKKIEKKVEKSSNS
ncbi:MAG: bactofilin family protein [Bacillota bacterium]